MVFIASTSCVDLSRDFRFFQEIMSLKWGDVVLSGNVAQMLVQVAIGVIQYSYLSNILRYPANVGYIRNACVSL